MARSTFKQHRMLYEIAVKTLMFMAVIIVLLLFIAIVKLSLWIIFIL